MVLDENTDPLTGISRKEKETQVRHARHRAKMAYLLIWICSTVAMFIAVAFMLYITRVNAQNLAFYIPVFAFAFIMGIVVPLTVKITKFYNIE
jgi:Na+/glutamate symporter